MKTEDAGLTTPSTLKFKAWRLGNGIMAVFFLVCVALQHNDPDPVLWMTVYALACLVCFTIVLSPHFHGYIIWKTLCGLELSYCLAMCCYTIMYVSEETQRAPHGHNPLLYTEGRELLGLAIVMLWIIACISYTPQRLQTTSSRQCEAALIILIGAASTIPLSLWGVCKVGSAAEYITYCKHICSGSG
ncbi:transmembrane protein 220-like [Watersipora subatra]|uniref:transmembrane protein 220-like n=1 Tax=Watersipora subatra TaxID=2589382 RepID=UPI00355B56DE